MLDFFDFFDFFRFRRCGFGHPATILSRWHGVVAVGGRAVAHLAHKTHTSTSPCRKQERVRYSVKCQCMDARAHAQTGKSLDLESESQEQVAVQDRKLCFRSTVTFYALTCNSWPSRCCPEHPLQCQTTPARLLCLLACLTGSHSREPSCGSRGRRPEGPRGKPLAPEQRVVRQRGFAASTNGAFIRASGSYRDSGPHVTSLQGFAKAAC